MVTIADDRSKSGGSGRPHAMSLRAGPVAQVLSRLIGQFEGGRGVDGHQVVDQALRIDALGEKPAAPASSIAWRSSVFT
jgi:hypothetical protein